MISLMERTYIRIGHSNYEKLYGSYGLTTLKDKHVEIHGDKMQFSFRGKKGIHHTISLQNKRLARTVRQCRDIPGKELFQYYTDDGEHRIIESGMVNDYLKEATGREFSAKDFRTWAGIRSRLSTPSAPWKKLLLPDKGKKIFWQYWIQLVRNSGTPEAFAKNTMFTPASSA